MLRGFLNEIKNTAINRATNRINNVISDALGGGRSDGLPRRSGGVDRSNYAKLNPFEGQHIAYPEDLGSNDQGHYIIFNINETENAQVAFSQHGGVVKYDGSLRGLEPGGVRGSNGKPLESTVSVPKKGTKRLKSSIAMYMPATLSVGQISKYGETEMGALTTGVSQVAAGVAQGDGLGKTVNNIKNQVVTQGGDFLEGSVKTAASTISQGAKEAMELSSGVVMNNRLETTFQGIDKRSFQYSFKMMPKSEKEADNVDQIVRMFRFYMSPSFEGGLQSRHMIVPATFDITYMMHNGKVNEYLNRVSTCVLQSANVTYGGERVQFFRPNEKGAPPVETNIELQFQEIDLITRERLALGF
tara:strand:- start:2379 stop:3452 length:1074 start_codon:yes stop_codon:yes gene_type:complete